MGHLAPPRRQLRAAGSAGAVLGRRERKKRATRTAVRDAALRLALRHGVENVTVEQIARAADIAPRTFFNYFSSKEEAVVAASAVGAEALVAEFRARPRTESVLQAIREAVLTVMNQGHADSRDHVEALRLVRRTSALLPAQLAVLAHQEQVLADAITERIRPDGDPPGARHESDPAGSYAALCAAAVLAALRVVLDRWLAHAVDETGTPPMGALRREVDEAITELAAGLDRPSVKEAEPPGQP